MSSPTSVVRQHIPVLPDNPYSLGRHVVHDEQSRAYRLSAPTVPITNQLWTVRIGRLNQNPLSSCTGNTGTYRLGTDDQTKQGEASVPRESASIILEILDETYAINLYSAATQVDAWNDTSYPPDDTGSSGLAVAKVLKHRGLIDSYSHCFSLNDVFQALQHGPVMLGTSWYQEFFTPDSRGLITIGGEVAGGHEYLAIGIDVDRREVICINSWGSDWGVNGVFRMSWDTLERLLHEKGDAMVLHVVIHAVPAPPVPGPPPTPSPVPDPIPAPVPGPEPTPPVPSATFTTLLKALFDTFRRVRRRFY